MAKAAVDPIANSAAPRHWPCQDSPLEHQIRRTRPTTRRIRPQGKLVLFILPYILLPRCSPIPMLLINNNNSNVVEVMALLLIAAHGRWSIPLKTNANFRFKPEEG